MYRYNLSWLTVVELSIHAWTNKLITILFLNQLINKLVIYVNRNYFDALVNSYLLKIRLQFFFSSGHPNICILIGTPLKSCHVTHLKKIFFENLYFLDNNVFSVSKHILWYPSMSSINLATRFKIGMYLLNREKRCNAFPRSTNIIVQNQLPTDKRHIKVPQDRLLCPTHVVDNKRKKQVFKFFHLSVLHN